MSNLEIGKNINKKHMLDSRGGASSGVVDLRDGNESGFERIFDAVKKRLSSQSGAAAGGNDLPVGALSIVPISPAINVLTTDAAAVSEDVIRTYARQQGLNPAVLGALLGHGWPPGAGDAGQSLSVAAEQGMQSLQPTLPAMAAGPQDSAALTGWADALDGMPAEKSPACAFDPGVGEALRALDPGLAAGRIAGHPEGAPNTGAGEVAAGETMPSGVLRSFGDAFAPSSTLRPEDAGAHERELEGIRGGATAGIPSAVTDEKMQGMAAAADVAGAAVRRFLDQSLQQTVQLKQTVLPIPSVVAGQLAQSLKFERVSSLQAHAPVVAAREAADDAAASVAEPQPLIGMVWHEEMDLTYFMSERGRPAGAEALSAASSLPNAGEEKTNEGVWRQERVQQDLQYQKLSEQMMEAVGRRITDRVAKGVWQMSFQLRPERLGRVDVSLGMANGTIDAAFSCSEAETRQLLDGGLTRLKEVLQGAGFGVGNLHTGGQGAGDRASRQLPSGDRERGLPMAGMPALAANSADLSLAGPRSRLAADGVDLIV